MLLRDIITIFYATLRDMMLSELLPTRPFDELSMPRRALRAMFTVYAAAAASFYCRCRF